MRDGYFPLILGGDGSATLGTVQAMKKHAPNTKTLWVDSIIEIPMSEAKESDSLSSLQLLTGINSPVTDQKCLDANELVFIGAKESNNFNANLDRTE